MLEEVQRDEGRGVQSYRRVVFTGSREWGQTVDRKGKPRPQEQFEHEIKVARQVIDRLIVKWVIGRDRPQPRDRTSPPGPGLTIVQGGAPGADHIVAVITREIAEGLRRRSRVEYDRIVTPPPLEILADGLELETWDADWSWPSGGHERNQKMIDSKPDHVIALFAHGRAYGSAMAGGTNDCVRRAVAAGVTVDVYEAWQRQWRKP